MFHRADSASWLHHSVHGGALNINCTHACCVSTIPGGQGSSQHPVGDQ